MPMLERVKTVLTGAAAMLAGPRREFACGDCERWRRCGLPPTADCAARGEQIARFDENRKMRDVVISNGAGWIYGRR